MNSEPRRRSQTLKMLATTGGLTLGVIGLTVMTAGASPPAQAEVEKASQVAERAAASEASIRTLKLDTASDRASGAGSDHASNLVAAAERFRPLDFPEVPDNWEDAGLDLQKAETNDQGELVQELPDGSRVVFTVDPDTQRYLDSVLASRPVPHGGVVMLEPETGRVLAMSEDSASASPDYQNFTRNARPPSASIFKVVTAAALMSEAGQGRHQEVCYHGGTRGLTQRNITGDPNLDNRCDDLEGALALSINSLIAKQTYHHLEPDDLLQWAERFGYNTPIPFELPVEPSTASFGDDPYEVARAAAGFWHTHMSPLHGAMIAASIANDGVMMAPSLIERYESPEGEVLAEFRPEVFREVMEPELARQLDDMMEATASRGTARNYFGQQPRFPNDIRVSGKTGTLSNQRPFLRFTWFVGTGHHRQWDDHSGVAVAGLMANEPEWHMVGPQVASKALRQYFRVESARRSVEEDAVVSR